MKMKTLKSDDHLITNPWIHFKSTAAVFDDEKIIIKKSLIVRSLIFKEFSNFQAGFKGLI